MTSPLADRIRPESIDQIVGQTHLLKDGAALRNIIEGGNIPNMIFYGPSGVGKTTLARIIAKNSGKTLCKLNGTNASTADIREVVKESETLAVSTEFCCTLMRFSILTKSSNRQCSNISKTEK